MPECRAHVLNFKLVYIVVDSLYNGLLNIQGVRITERVIKYYFTGILMNTPRHLIRVY